MPLSDSNNSNDNDNANDSDSDSDNLFNIRRVKNGNENRLFFTT